MSVEENTADREARNDYLSNLDEVWESCREAVESARGEYEDALDLARMSFESEQAEAAAEYGHAIDEAWTAYKTQVAETPAIGRRDAIAEARATYNERAALIRESYESGAHGQHEEYLQASHDAKLEYEAAVESAFSGYREAITSVAEFVPHSSGPKAEVAAPSATAHKKSENRPRAEAVEETLLDTGGDESLLELAEALAARSGAEGDGKVAH
jgi:hypothetical protein